MLFIGRRGPVSQVGQWFKEEPTSKSQSLNIGSIYGPGGIGKTFLLDYSIQQIDQFDELGYLTLRIDGQKTVQSLEQLVTKECVERVELPDQANFSFPRLSALSKQWSALSQRAEYLIRKEYKEVPQLEELMLTLLNYGMAPQRALEMRPYDLALADTSQKELEQAVESLLKLRPYKIEHQWFQRFLGKTRNKTLRNALRREQAATLADAFVEDFQDLFKQLKKAKPSSPWEKMRRPRQLLIILDDYESISSMMSPFLAEHLVPKLLKASFRTLMVVLGRDSLLATHTSWGQHHRALISDRLIELKPFEEQEAYELMRRRGIHDSHIWQCIWEDTQGYPFLLDLECEDELTGGTSALGLKLFFDRLTRWMTPIQKAWIVPLSFLHEINLETVKKMLPKHDASAILDWFKMEPSVRDPHAHHWQVIGFVRRRIQQYVRNDSPERYEKLKKRAEEIQAASDETRTN